MFVTSVTAVSKEVKRRSVLLLDVLHELSEWSKVHLPKIATDDQMLALYSAALSEIQQSSVSTDSTIDGTAFVQMDSVGGQTTIPTQAPARSQSRGEGCRKFLPALVIFILYCCLQYFKVKPKIIMHTIAIEDYEIIN